MANMKDARRHRSRRTHPAGPFGQAHRRGVKRSHRWALAADRVIARAVSASGDVALFGHGHMLRVLAARWLDLEPQDGRLFALSTASVSVLGYEHDTRVIWVWNRTHH